MQPKIILVTGSVATGKTTTAKEISRKTNCEYININELIKKNKIYDNYNRKLDSYEVKINKLNTFLIKLIKKNRNGLVLDSHLSHYIDSKYADLCVVCKCDIKMLKKRLEIRGYSEEKIRENLDSEIFDVCLVEALEKKHKVIIVDTTENKLNYNIKIIIERIKEI